MVPLVLIQHALVLFFCFLPDPLPSYSSPFSPWSVSPFLFCLFSLRICVYAHVVPLSSFHILLLSSSLSLCLFLLPLLPFPYCMLSAHVSFHLVISSFPAPCQLIILQLKLVPVHCVVVSSFHLSCLPLFPLILQFSLPSFIHSSFLFFPLSRVCSCHVRSVPVSASSPPYTHVSSHHLALFLFACPPFFSTSVPHPDALLL